MDIYSFLVVALVVVGMVEVIPRMSVTNVLQLTVVTGDAVLLSKKLQRVNTIFAVILAIIFIFLTGFELKFCLWTWPPIRWNERVFTINCFILIAVICLALIVNFVMMKRRITGKVKVEPGYKIINIFSNDYLIAFGCKSLFMVLGIYCIFLSVFRKDTLLSEPIFVNTWRLWLVGYLITSIVLAVLENRKIYVFNNGLITYSALTRRGSGSKYKIVKEENKYSLYVDETFIAQTYITDENIMLHNQLQEKSDYNGGEAR